MSVTVPQALLHSELRSIGKLVYEVFGGSEPILFERRQEEDRPFWRVDASTTSTIARVASGWDDGPRVYVLTYAGIGYANVMEKVDVLRTHLRDSVPFYTFDACWLNPRIEVIDAEPGPAPNLAPGAYTISCSFVSDFDEETLPSKSFGVTLVAPKRLRLYAPAWPFGAPLRGSARFYVGAGSGARKRAAEVSFPAYPAVGWASAVISELPGSGAPVEVSKSRMFLGPLSVNQVTANTFESLDTDGHFDAVFTLFCSRPLPLDLYTSEGYRAYQDGEVIVTSDDDSPVTVVYP